MGSRWLGCADEEINSFSYSNNSRGIRDPCFIETISWTNSLLTALYWQTAPRNWMIDRNVKNHFEFDWKIENLVNPFVSSIHWKRWNCIWCVYTLINADGVAEAQDDAVILFWYFEKVSRYVRYGVHVSLQIGFDWGEGGTLLFCLFDFLLEGGRGRWPLKYVTIPYTKDSTLRVINVFIFFSLDCGFFLCCFELWLLPQQHLFHKI